MHRLYHELAEVEKRIDTHKWVMSMREKDERPPSHSARRIRQLTIRRNRILRLFDFLLDNGGKCNG